MGGEGRHCCYLVVGLEVEEERGVDGEDGLCDVDIL